MYSSTFGNCDTIQYFLNEYILGILFVLHFALCCALMFNNLIVRHKLFLTWNRKTSQTFITVCHGLVELNVLTIIKNDLTHLDDHFPQWLHKNRMNYNPISGIIPFMSLHPAMSIFALLGDMLHFLLFNNNDK